MSVTSKRKSRRYGSTSKKEQVGVKTSVQVDAMCPICQETIGTKNPEGITEGWSLLPCGHRFGSYCIKHYLNVVAEDRPSCPVCRQIAYHMCGHPVLPVLVKPNESSADKIVEASDLLIEEMKRSNCAYCQSPIGEGGTTLTTITSGRRSKQRGAGGQASRWKSLVGWIRILSFSRRRRSARSGGRLLSVEVGPGERDGPPFPGLSRTSNTGASGPTFPTLSQQPQPSQGDGSGWTGPWVDPFPKARDHEWEKWWKLQEPRGA